MRSKFTSAVLLTVLAGGLAYAQPPQTGQVSVDYTCSEETQFYNGGGFESMSDAEVRAPAPLGNFTYDFGATAGADVISFTWSAPAGQMFQITVPEGWDMVDARLETLWGTSSTGAGMHSDTDADVQIGGAAGEPLVIGEGRVSLTGPGPGFNSASGQVTLTLAPGSVYQFTSLTLSSTVPDTYTLDFADVPVSSPPGLRGFAMKMGDPAPPDPGQWITLVPVPSTVPTLSEWGVICLVLGLALCAMVRMRKMKLQPGSAMN